MAQKTPTSWVTNPNISAGVAYNSSTTTYNSATTAYSSADAATDKFGKTPELWTKVTKTAEAWSFNPAANTSLYVYDSASHTYDSAVDTYDGVVSGQDFGDQETATLWSQL